MPTNRDDEHVDGTDAPEPAPDTEPEPEPEPESAAADASEADAAQAEAPEPEAPEAEEPEPTGPGVEELAAEVSSLSAQLKETQARLRAVSKAYTDQKEEMAAFRERMEGAARAKETQHAFQTVKNFFDPVQNLKRSLDAGSPESDGFLAGLKLVLHQFEEGLNRLGLEPVPGVGSTFDPNLHEALALAPVTDAAQDGVVLMVHVDGYMVGGRVLQASQVVVGKHTPAAPEPEPEADEAEEVDADEGVSDEANTDA